MPSTDGKERGRKRKPENLSQLGALVVGGHYQECCGVVDCPASRIIMYIKHYFSFSLKKNRFNRISQVDTKLDVFLFCEQFSSLGFFNCILLLTGIEGIQSLGQALSL